MNEISMVLQKDVESAFRYFGVSRTSSTPYTDVTQSRKKTKHVKRPMNAFMYWAQKERRKIIADNPDIHNATISKTLGARWKSIAAEEKKQHEYVAKLLGLLHQFEYPSYKYCPKKRGTQKTEKNVKPLTPESAVPKRVSPSEIVPDDRLSELSYSSAAEVAITNDDLHYSRMRSADSLESGFWESEPSSKVPRSSTSAVSPSGSLQSEPFFEDEYAEKDSEYTTDIDIFKDFPFLDFEMHQLPSYQTPVTSKVKIESDYNNNNNSASTTTQLFATPRLATTLVSQPFLHFAVSLPPSPQPYDTTANLLCDSILPLDLQDIEIFPDILWAFQQCNISDTWQYNRSGLYQFL